MDNDLSKLPPPPKGQIGISPNSIGNLPPPPQGQSGQTLEQILAGQKQQPSLMDKVAGGITSFFPGKTIGENIGTLGGYAYTKAKDLMQGTNVASNYDLSHPTLLQNAGDVAQGALTVAAPEIGKGATALGKIGANVALGAGLGSSGAVAQGQGLKDTAKSGALGGALGGGLSAGGEMAGYLSKNLPNWFTKLALPKLGSNLKGTPQETIDYALNNTKGASLKSMYSNSSNAIKSYENQVQAVLSHPQYANETGNLLTQGAPSTTHIHNLISHEGAPDATQVANYKQQIAQGKSIEPLKIIKEGSKYGVEDGKHRLEAYRQSGITNIPTQEINTSSALNKIKTDFSNAGLDENKISNIIKQVAPSSKNIVDKVISGTANLQEQNILRKELDQATKAAYGDKPTLSFAKTIGKSMADFLRNNVQGTAKETDPIFSEYSKEHGLNKALGTALNKKRVAGPLIAGGAGFAHGGIKGALEAVAVEEGLRNPTAKLLAAKGIRGLSNAVSPIAKTAFQGGKAPLIKNLSSRKSNQ